MRGGYICPRDKCTFQPQGETKGRSHDDDEFGDAAAGDKDDSNGA